MSLSLVCFLRIPAAVIYAGCWTGCAGTHDPNSDSTDLYPPSVEVTAKDLKAQASRMSLNGKAIRFNGLNALKDDPDQRGGFVLDGKGGLDVLLPPYSVANQQQAKELLRTSGQRVVVAGIYSDHEVSMAGVHPYGALEVGRLLGISKANPPSE